jgi:2-oxoglutarate/2-oxoacid ferredoxin oxidoreductase subunit alpha
MPTRDLKLAMIGSGGDGVVTMGDLIAMAAARDGLNVMKTESYGPQIRGGESSCTVRISPDPIYSQGDFVDVMVVFGWVDYARFRSEIVASPDAIILHEESDVTPMPDLGLSQAARTIAVPFIQLAKETAGTTASKNIVTLGILAELFGLPNEPLRRAVENRFSKKKEAVLESNLKGFDGGVLWAANHTASTAARKLEYTASETKLLISGNEASALGAIHAGCRFFAGYPITPSSEVLHFLSEWMPRVGGSVVQTEDELSAIGAVIGGSFAGVK